MTRARIEIVDSRTRERNVLYRGSDGYPEGLGDDLVTACDLCLNASDLDSFTFKLLKSKAGLELDTFGEHAWLDWVYTIEWQPGSVKIVAQEIDPEVERELPIVQRVKQNRIDVHEFVAAHREKVKQRNEYVAELKKKIGSCPLCGEPADVYVSLSRDEFAVKCLHWGCRNGKEIRTNSEEELIKAWRESDSKNDLLSVIASNWGIAK